MTNPEINPQPGMGALLSCAPVIPVVVIDRVEDAVPLARALVAGGLPVIEVTLRTDAALAAIKAMCSVVGAIVGAGTVLDAAQLRTVRAAGARFAVSPGACPALLDAAEEAGAPLLPGIATPSEAMALIARGYQYAKFFPAEAAGGASYLKALASPLPQLRFCPTGGVSLANAAHYLALANVVCVGGSWMVKPDMIAQGDWRAVTTAARDAANLRADAAL